jgi:hypothetical protein
MIAASFSSGCSSVTDLLDLDLDSYSDGENALLGRVSPFKRRDRNMPDATGGRDKGVGGVEGDQRGSIADNKENTVDCSNNKTHNNNNSKSAETTVSVSGEKDSKNCTEWKTDKKKTVIPFSEIFGENKSKIEYNNENNVENQFQDTVDITENIRENARNFSFDSISDKVNERRGSWTNIHSHTDLKSLSNENTADVGNKKVIDNKKNDENMNNINHQNSKAIKNADTNLNRNTNIHPDTHTNTHPNVSPNINTSVESVIDDRAYDIYTDGTHSKILAYRFERVLIVEVFKENAGGEIYDYVVRSLVRCVVLCHDVFCSVCFDCVVLYRIELYRI